MSLPHLNLENLDPVQLDRACRDWGSFTLSGHGIETDLAFEALAQCRNFFGQPLKKKNRIRRNAVNSWGFFDAELTKNRRDCKEIVDIGPPVTSGSLAGSFPQWPELPGFRECMEELSAQQHRVALQLIEALARALHSTMDLAAPFTEHSSFLRLNYYPPCPDPAADADFQPDPGQFGIGHHTDAGAVTVLLHDSLPGLQIYHNGGWHTVTPVAGTLIINIGDIVQVWSNDRYPAPLHRVLASAAQPRITLPYFLNPDYAYDYAPLPDGIPGQQSPRYRAINWGTFRSLRSAGDYADHGEEIQISDYATAQ